MAHPRVGGHNAVPAYTPHHRHPYNSGVCACGAVFDYGNVVVPAEFFGMCGRCASKRGLRLTTSLSSPATSPRGSAFSAS